MEKIARENTFDEKKKRPGEKFNPGLALIGLRTTGSSQLSVLYSTQVFAIYNALRFPG